ncbi:hypothetical protein ACNPM8_16830 [Glutamicibacter sp. AGC46]
MTLDTDFLNFYLKPLLNPGFPAEFRGFHPPVAGSFPIGNPLLGVVKFYFVASDNNANNRQPARVAE